MDDFSQKLGGFCTVLVLVNNRDSFPYGVSLLIEIVVSQREK